MHVLCFVIKKSLLSVSWTTTSKRQPSIDLATAHKFEKQNLHSFSYSFLVLHFDTTRRIFWGFCLVWVMLKPKKTSLSQQWLVNSVIQFRNYGCFYYFLRMSANFSSSKIMITIFFDLLLSHSDLLSVYYYYYYCCCCCCYYYYYYYYYYYCYYCYF